MMPAFAVCTCFLKLPAIAVWIHVPCLSLGLLLEKYYGSWG
jgi:hypothetical protein